MSTRTDWGLFDKAGNPVAVGDEWAKWVCPRRTWRNTGYVCDFSGEWVDTGPELVQCPWKCAGVKLDVCERCGMQFRYP